MVRNTDKKIVNKHVYSALFLLISYERNYTAERMTEKLESLFIQKERTHPSPSCTE